MSSELLSSNGTTRISGVLFFHGAADDLQVYVAALSQDEVAWLAGARAPIDPRS
jgi:hypothetical protein